MNKDGYKALQETLNSAHGLDSYNLVPPEPLDGDDVAMVKVYYTAVGPEAVIRALEDDRLLAIGGRSRSTENRPSLFPIGFESHITGKRTGVLAFADVTTELGSALANSN